MGQVRGAHLSKITKGGAAQLVVIQRLASPPASGLLNFGKNSENFIANLDY
jgi:hypothetical protein